MLGTRRLGYITLCGAIAGLAPDIDVFMASDTDPLMFLEYHRQFTHSLVFIPAGALIVALLLKVVLRGRLQFREIYLACFLGYASHGLLDACTSYGTQLFWPFTDLRVSWNIISIIDPLFTIPVLAAIASSLIFKKRLFALLGLGWILFYLTFGTIQSSRALTAGESLAATRGHDPQQLTIKAGFANVILWKLIYRDGAMFYVEAIRVQPFGNISVCGVGSSIRKLNVERDFPWLKESQQRTDVERFSWFSQDYVAVDKRNPNRVIDVRYSVLPNEVDSLWGVELDRAADVGSHVNYVELQRFVEGQMSQYWDYVRGAGCTEP